LFYEELSMDGELLRWLYHKLLGVEPPATPRCRYCDGLIVLIGLYATLNNRSLRWAASRQNWPIWCQRVLRFPSYSQVRRRMLKPGAMLLLLQLDTQLKQRLGTSSQKIADGKPLIVGGFSKDRDATRGHVPGGFARGYKLHAVRDGVTGIIDVSNITGLAAGEATVLRPMLRKIPLRGCVLRADANYDSNALYATAASRGGRLIAPRRKPGRGLGHGHHHPHRLEAITALENTLTTRREHIRRRSAAERTFADLGNRVGLFALPNFIRRRHRVRRWVRAKILLYHLILVLERKV
jgi:hypothetical protein